MANTQNNEDNWDTGSMDSPANMKSSRQRRGANLDNNAGDNQANQQDTTGDMDSDNDFGVG